VTTAPPIRLVCLDMAGTTVADGGTVETAFARAMDAMGVRDPDRLAAALAHVRVTMGQSKITVFRHLFAGDEDAAAAANRAFERSYDALVDTGRVEGLPGAAETLAGLRERGLGVCLTTGFAPGTRDRILDALGWWSLVDLALSPVDAGGRGRPYPDMNLTAALHFGLDDVRESAVVGDTSNDLLAGWRAGAGLVVGVLSGAHDRATLEAAPHTHVLADVTGLPALLGRP